MTTFILLTAPWLENRGVHGVVALFLGIGIGIGMVIALLELGDLPRHRHTHLSAHRPTTVERLPGGADSIGTCPVTARGTSWIAA